MSILTSVIYNWKTRRHFEAIRSLLGTQMSSAAVSPADQVFVFGAGGLDEKALVRFRSHKHQTLHCNLVQVGSWREWHDSNFELEQLLERACHYIKRRSPVGPIRLAGHSQGGLLAYATAVALERLGSRVKCVVLFDTAESGLGKNVYAASGIARGLIGPAKDWLVLKILRKNTYLRAGDPKFRLLATIDSLPAGAHLVATIARLASFAASRRTSIKLDSVIQRARLQKMWFNWINKRAPAEPLQAPVFLLRSGEPDSDDRGWSRHRMRLIIVPVAGNHHTMLAPENLDNFISRFNEAMTYQYGKSDTCGL